ncbi:MAG: efflux transporter, permease protein [Nonomuraea muscovyensis]|nr:efflux transporter, permease protein [Nonomuraea muscovyensis]
MLKACRVFPYGSEGWVSTRSVIEGSAAEVGSVNQLFDEAKPPHFLQMHKGDDDPDALARFAAAHPEIDAWFVEEMLGFDSAAIAWHRPATGESGDLADSLIDNLFVTQNEEFDFLIDETGAIPRPSQGEVYVPVAYQQRFALHTGDRLAIRTDNGFQDLRVQGFVRDAQMASSLSSATRFLVSGADFRELGRAGGGAPEIIVEYRLADPSLAAEFQRAYESDEALPKNGQAVTFQMIRIINAFSDGLVAVALVFVSLLLVVIALLNLRFVIRGTLEDEVREIGAMKAIGLPHKAIARLYLAKYRVMTFLACIVVAICRGVLRGVKKIQVVNALVHGSTLNERQTARRAEPRPDEFGSPASPRIAAEASADAWRFWSSGPRAGNGS